MCQYSTVRFCAVTEDRHFMQAFDIKRLKTVLMKCQRDIAISQDPLAGPRAKHGRFLINVIMYCWLQRFRLFILQKNGKQ